MANPSPANTARPSAPNLDTRATDDFTGTLGDLNLTETAETLDRSTPIPPGLTRLSEWLAQVPDSELCMVLSDYHTAVLTTIDALPVLGETFTRSVLDPLVNQGKAQTRTLDEELVRTTAEANAWLAEKRKQSRYHIMRHSGKVALSIAELVDDSGNFDRMLIERRTYLEQQQGVTAAPKPSPKTPPRQRSKARAKTPAKTSNT